ncbi:hypothetical protein [Gordonia sp. NPDC003950]
MNSWAANTAARITAFVVALAAVFAIAFAVGHAWAPTAGTDHHTDMQHSENTDQHGGH